MGKKDVQHANVTMVVAEITKTDIVLFNQEKVVGKAYQTKERKEEVDRVNRRKMLMKLVR
ncbi:hypothetical protein GIB67_014382 [Kingdonia uniflora]|uniref:Uncharacterized protein n=1 Tax=Kingdonia uniflora TaxID=39325 RepID=A0A7J7LD32_9MAGN|nr:hypothetical protein GIB67_014382 [Kingdonia uniflora]